MMLLMMMKLAPCVAAGWLAGRLAPMRVALGGFWPPLLDGGENCASVGTQSNQLPVSGERGKSQEKLMPLTKRRALKSKSSPSGAANFEFPNFFLIILLELIGELSTCANLRFNSELRRSDHRVSIQGESCAQQIKSGVI